MFKNQYEYLPLHTAEGLQFSLNFYFTTPPFEADTHILTLQYRETDGTSYEMIFKPVIVEP